MNVWWQVFQKNNGPHSESECIAYSCFMEITGLDWAIIGGYFALALGVGLWASKVAGKTASGFFLAGRNMPWWLLGISMGGNDIFYGYTQPRYGVGQRTRCKRQLGVVGIFADGNADRLCLRPLVAAFRGFDGH